MSNKNRSALVVHGFNLKPQMMQRLTENLTALGFDSVVNVELSGHGPSDRKPSVSHPLSAEQWLDDIVRSLTVPSEQTTVFGFSLGGLLLTILQAQGVEFRNTYLFAPALALRDPYPSMLQLAQKWLPPAAFIPSLAPSTIGANRFLHSSFYNALAQAYQMRSLVAESVKAHIFIDPRDEVVSFSKLQSWKQQRGLQGLKIHEISASRRPRHLILSDQTIEAQSWQSIVKLVQKEMIQ